MKLYEAMLKGARSTYQAFGTWHDGNGGACAMGAVMVGMGFKINPHDWYGSFKDMQKVFPELQNSSKCPECDEVSCLWSHLPSLMDVVMHLNDKHHWSRQRIAEWLSGSKISEAKQTVKEGATV